jgi:two-component system, chemotaxis family, chemotaxis protein CheY
MTNTVLTVDDSKAIRDMVSFTLTAAGYEVIEAADGVEGLEQLRRRKVSLVLTDLNMPRMNGLDFLVNARKEPNGTGVPIVLLTTESKPEMKARGKELGATGWISKPFDAQMLLAVAKKLVG